MSLEAGARIGPYEVVCALGHGGMGEVYRGRDSRLGRDVAIKTLPVLFARDPERNARFAREAQLLAALNHPHIGGIYGVEEDSTSTFLILEFVDGLSLAGRLAHGPLTSDETVLGTPRMIQRPSRLVARVGYDVSPDGKRLLMVEEITGDAQRGTSVTVAQNWFAAFRK